MDLFSEIVQLQSEYEQSSQKLQSTKKNILNLSMQLKDSISNSQMLSDSIERVSNELISLTSMISIQKSILFSLETNSLTLDENSIKLAEESQLLFKEFQSIRFVFNFKF